MILFVVDDDVYGGVGEIISNNDAKLNSSLTMLVMVVIITMVVIIIII